MENYLFLKVYILDKYEIGGTRTTRIRVEKIDDIISRRYKDFYMIKIPKQFMSNIKLISILTKTYKGTQLETGSRIDQIDICDKKQEADEWLQSLKIMYKLAK